MDYLPLNTNNFPPLNSFSYSVRAEGSFIKAKRPDTSQRGFTLLELLAVLFIIGIVISFASLSIGQRSSRVVQDEAERLYGLVRMASEEAVLQGRELAIEFTQESYRFLELNNSNQWAPVEQDALFRERSLPPNVRVELIVDGIGASFEDKKNLPRIFVLSSGELTSFELNLKLDDGQAYALQGSINGKLDLSRVAENGFDG